MRSRFIALAGFMAIACVNAQAASFSYLDQARSISATASVFLTDNGNLTDTHSLSAPDLNTFNQSVSASEHGGVALSGATAFSSADAWQESFLQPGQIQFVGATDENDSYQGNQPTAYGTSSSSLSVDFTVASAESFDLSGTMLIRAPLSTADRFEPGLPVFASVELLKSGLPFIGPIRVDNSTFDFSENAQPFDQFGLLTPGDYTFVAMESDGDALSFGTSTQLSVTLSATTVPIPQAVWTAGPALACLFLATHLMQRSRSIGYRTK